MPELLHCNRFFWRSGVRSSNSGTKCLIYVDTELVLVHGLRIHILKHAYHDTKHVYFRTLWTFQEHEDPPLYFPSS